MKEYPPFILANQINPAGVRSNPPPSHQINAAGALCNLGLDFSSVKNVVLSNGALGPLV